MESLRDDVKTGESALLIDGERIHGVRQNRLTVLPNPDPL